MKIANVIITLMLISIPTCGLTRINDESMSKVIYCDEKIPNTPTVKKIEYPELPKNIPDFKNLIDLSNQTIENFNHGKLQMLSGVIHEKWHKEIIEKYTLKASDDKTDMTIGMTMTVVYENDNSNKGKTTGTILILSTRPTNSHGKCIWVISNIRFEGDKVDCIASELFGPKDDFLAVMRFSGDEITYESYNFDKDKPMPWVKWDKNGKIKEQGCKSQNINDSDIMKVFNPKQKKQGE